MRTSNKLILILGFLLILSTFSFGQSLFGVVTTEETGKKEPLFGANVYWLGTTVGTTTKENGTFFIDRVAQSNLLVVSFVGYAADTIEITDQNSIMVTLNPETTLNEVVVEGWKPSSGIKHLEGINTLEMSEDELFKAACCNLSESFETNPSVDVAFTDAVSGTKQIQMLGLSGPNVMISVENMPGLRGLSSNYGLSFIPGSWINAIQVTKGVGSVVNGHESIAGQINVELKKPQESDKLFLNGYINQSGRTELNTVYTQRVGDKWATTTLLHGSVLPTKMDNNDDGFLDFPKSDQVNFISRWVYKGKKGWLGQFGVKVLEDNKIGGQTSFDEDMERTTSNPYGVKLSSTKYEGFGKMGFVFSGKEYKSFGFQFNTYTQKLDSYYGLNNYDANEDYVYSNFIYQSIIGNTQHKFKTGLSYSYNHMDEEFNALALARTEHVSGGFFEYTYDNLDDLILILGARLDYNSLFGEIFTPRVHVKYSPFETTAIRLSAGSGTRTANIISENASVLASSRTVLFENLQTNAGYGFNQDKAWNFGLNVSQEFRLNYRDGIINFDVYHTKFDNQVILDLDRNSQEAVFTSLIGDSYSNSIQFQVDYELLKRLDLRMAYRWLDVTVDYNTGELQKPLIPQHRAFVNFEYETLNKWAFDYTVQWTGEQRIPNTESNPAEFRRSDYSEEFVLMNAQITKTFDKGWAVYVGMENITDYQQKDAIIAANDSFGAYFDSSLIWGPIFGRMAYAGFRYRIK
ncbi:TonB-dependent receptor [Fulvivirga lutea]|uniref:TonB-dependent receptor n=1 Tax=Fulvivirga lutea TaxID=2810512 RepID=A0A974WFA2_9BACT|nr:TonB-dependent receptor [Fulvivirga lutea]QSE97393.1 TonB-dependent receptor [Fulvivirga lutea]